MLAQEIPPASLTARLAGEVIDLAVALGPALALWFGGLDAASPAWWAALAWAAVCLLAGIVFEGTCGATLGWLAGTRVLGTDLCPCGLVRAAVRQAGGFLAPWLAAVTEERQHPGDLSARTVVLRKRR